MIRLTLSSAAALALTLGLGSVASATDWLMANSGRDEVYTSTTQLPIVAIDGCNGGCNGNCGACDGCGDCGDCDGCSEGYFFEFELLVLQYLRADGLRVAGLFPEANNVPSELAAAPRISVGYISPDGLGVRLRYFQFSQGLNAIEPNSAIVVDTYTIDAELFERFALNQNWDLEASLGARFNEFSETITDAFLLPNIPVGLSTQNSLHAFGLITGLELRRQVGGGAVYGRVRQSILAGDKVQSIGPAGGPLFEVSDVRDAVFGITELNIGYEVCSELDNGGVVYGRIGGEYQLWSNYSGSTIILPLPIGTTDVGFAGISFTAGIYY